MEDEKVIINIIELTRKEFKEGLEIHLDLEAVKMCDGNITFEHAANITYATYKWWAKIMNKYQLSPLMDLRFEKFSGTIRVYGQPEETVSEKTCGFNIAKECADNVVNS